MYKSNLKMLKSYRDKLRGLMGSQREKSIFYREMQRLPNKTRVRKKTAALGSWVPVKALFVY